MILEDIAAHIPWSQPGRLRRAWCELTGGHDSHLLTASRRPSPNSKRGVYAVALSCGRCGRQTRWFNTAPAQDDVTRHAVAMRSALQEAREYFDQRADISSRTDDAGNPYPNDEMILLQEIDEVLNGRPFP